MVTSQSISPFIRKRKRLLVEASSSMEYNTELSANSPYSMQAIFKHDQPQTRRCTNTARSLQHLILESDDSSDSHSRIEVITSLTSDGWKSIEHEEYIAEILQVREDLSLFLNIILDLCKDLSNEGDTSQLYCQQLQIYAHQVTNYENEHSSRSTDELCDLLSLICHDLNCFYRQHLHILDLQEQFAACRDRFFNLLVKKEDL
ncbi:unnamed protein product [Albugo candida]|uniref:Uncharacterized protein n=1 Tax=Albugo candida TaxID=65357 RepID=A0A024GQI1_9STRA|nr:unnamed protein product [Albugo candida]|eukprot:CCI49036.1 unnamed protein product [Albugo candida]